MKKVAIVVDRPKWAFDRIAEALLRYSSGRSITMDIYYVKGGGEDARPRLYDSYDLVFFMHWSLAIEVRETLYFRFINKEFRHKKLVLPDYIDANRTLVGIHAHDDWDDRRSRPDVEVLPPAVLIELLSSFRATNAVSKRLHRIFAQAGLANLSYTPNGVEETLFAPAGALGESARLRVGCTGKTKRDWNKGLTEYIRPLEELPFVEVCIAGESEPFPYEKMPLYYNDIDVFVCASASEGCSLSVLEASACGRPVVSTRVGGSEDLIADGVGGFLIDRSVDAIAEKLELLNADRDLLATMGNDNRKKILEQWTWQHRAGAWLDYIEDHLD